MAFNPDYQTCSCSRFGNLGPIYSGVQHGPERTTMHENKPLHLFTLCLCPFATLR